MTDILALLSVAALGYFIILDFEPNDWFKDMINKWFRMVHVGGLSNRIAAWGACVAFPAVVVGSLSVVLSNELINFIFDAVVLLLTTAVGSFMRYHRSLLRAVYANDAKLAAQVANTWERRESSVEDAKERFVQRMLGLCALRLHQDVLAVFFWYMLLGPAGAVLIAAHNAFSRDETYWSESFRLLNYVADGMTITLFGVVGNMRPALERLQRFDVVGAALGSAGFIDGDYDIESVPRFGNNLMNTFFLGIGGAALIMIMFMI